MISTLLRSLAIAAPRPARDLALVVLVALRLVDIAGGHGCALRAGIDQRQHITQDRIRQLERALELAELAGGKLEVENDVVAFGEDAAAGLALGVGADGVGKPAPAPG